MEIIKIKKRVYKVLDITREPFMKFGVFRGARERIGCSVQKTCFNCHKKFTDSDDVYMAITTGGNILLCEKCAKIAIKDLNSEKGENEKY